MSGAISNTSEESAFNGTGPEADTKRSDAKRLLERAISESKGVESVIKKAFRDHIQSDWGLETVQRLNEACRDEESRGAALARDVAQTIRRLLTAGEGTLGGIPAFPSTPERRAIRVPASGAGADPLSCGDVSSSLGTSGEEVLGRAASGESPQGKGLLGAGLSAEELIAVVSKWSAEGSSGKCMV